MIDYLVGSVPIPDFLLRTGIKHLIKDKKREIHTDFGKEDEAKSKLEQYAESLKSMPIVVMADKANEQHYEVPSEFYHMVLGKNLKYSCCSWEKATNLDEAEVEMLESYIEKGQFEDGQTVLDMGCGWGSFSLYAAQKFPNSKFTAVSNSSTQKAFIEEKAKNLGISNLTVITQNIAEFDPGEKLYDRVISIEMLEHVKNYQKLFSRLSKWLKDDGKFFVHIFTHHQFAYHYEVKDSTDWMTKYFFEGGMMPSDKLFYHFQDNLKIDEHWTLNGYHYEKTSLAWLKNMDNNKPAILKLFAKTYGDSEAMKWFRYWRVFFLACEELWAFDKGNEWVVSHYLFSKK